MLIIVFTYQILNLEFWIYEFFSPIIFLFWFWFLIFKYFFFNCLKTDKTHSFLSKKNKFRIQGSGFRLQFGYWLNHVMNSSEVWKCFIKILLHNSENVSLKFCWFSKRNFNPLFATYCELPNKRPDQNKRVCKEKMPPCSLIH